MLRVLGSASQDLPRLQRLCLWLAPSLYTARTPAPEAPTDAIFAGIEPLSRRFVSLILEPDEHDHKVTQVGEHTLVTKGGVIQIKKGSQHIGTVNQGRWRMLAEAQDQAAMIRALPGWIKQVEAEERTRGVPSHQLWLGIGKAFQADTIIGCNPLVAPACYRAAICGRDGLGWGNQETKRRKVHNLLALPPDIMRTIAHRLSRDEPWLALTRARSLTPEAEEHLGRVGARIFVWRRGAIVAASAGVWRKAQVRSVQSQEAWTLWASARVAEEEGDELKEALQAIPLTRDGTVPLVRSCPSFREAKLGPVGSALAHAGVTVATDGAVKEDGRMGAAYVALDGRIPARSFVVLGPPSSMRAELSGMDEVATDAPMDEDLTILTDSLSSIQKLCCMQRQDFPEWLHGHPERPLLQSLVTRINTRARAQVVTRIIKVPAHRAHVLNEAADAAASRAAEAADAEIVSQCHADTEAVRFYLGGSLTEWCAGVRKYLAQVATSQHKIRLTALSAQLADAATDVANSTEDRRRGRALTLTDKWLLRQDQGREYLGQVLADMRCGAQKRRLLQTIAGMFPCRALLHRWGKAPSPQCLLCGGESETVAHVQCWCPALREARIAAHHAIAARILTMLKTHSIGRWQFHAELAVGSLRAIDVPLDMYDAWNNMVDALEEMAPDDDMADVERPQVLARLRPDAFAISWSKRQILLLELTRAHDWKQNWAETTDAFKTQRYERLQVQMQGLLPGGWVVETVPLTIGIRGSICKPTWARILDRLGINTISTQEHFLRDLTRQALEELDRMYGVRGEALRRLNDGQDARRS